MTVLIGQRQDVTKPDPVAARRAAWVQRFHAAPRAAIVADGPPPVPSAEIAAHAPVADAWRATAAARTGGQLGVVAHRIEAQKAARLRTGHRMRTAGTIQQGVRGRTVAAVGRGTDAHYDALHPVGDAVLNVALPTFSPREATASLERTLVRLDPRIVLERARHTAQVMLHAPRMVTSRKALLAAMAGLMVMACAATAVSAQERYVVQPGDTLQSIAEEFGVDPEAIARASYMPNGDEVTAGQVLVIADQGQSPEDAASMAAAREGTSPWAIGAHTVVYGDTLASIAATWDVSVDDLLAMNPGVDEASLLPGTIVVIPGDSGEHPVEEAQAVSSNASGLIPMDAVKQSHHLSCEYAATSAATTAFGAGISEQTFVDSVPQARNPHYGFRGNIDGQWGNTDDYGVYPEALVPTLNANGYVGDVIYSYGDTAQLKSELDAGHPVVVWLGFWGDDRQQLKDDGTYAVFAGAHVMTVYGYDDAGVYLIDPFTGAPVFYEWGSFVQLWAAMDGMGLAVYPA